MARRFACVPVYYLGNVLTIAMSQPQDAQAVASIERAIGGAVSAMFAFPDEIENAQDIQYGTSKTGLEQLSDKLLGEIDPLAEINQTKLKELAASSGVVELVRSLMLYCVKHNASDIHIQPTAKTLNVRFRIDGELQTLVRLHKGMNAPVIARLKVLSGLDIVEKRQPQDGRVSLELKNRTYDFRLSTVPTVFGEKAVIRAIGTSDKSVKQFHQLGFSRHNLYLLNNLLKLPNGVLYVTGPTGSGKTTTLYSILSKLNRPELNLVTVEDPVELRIDGVTQIQTNAAVGLDFAKALRSVLRQDPEVVLIGEIRDLETAQIASQAALTGHLVMSTLHTNNAIQAITRLVDLGIKPNLVAPSVIGVIAQRLVRRICPHCKESYQPDEAVIESLFHNRGSTRVQFFRGRGCDECGHSGYAGRLPIHEVIVITDTIREMISNEVSIVEIQREMDNNGFRSLRYDGVLKVLLGLTTFEEVDRVTAA
jgi:type IV pilus assembly protein PilB